MLNSFTVRSFKSIVDQTIHPGKVNVFIGANGSGKSNILEALGVLSAAAAGRVDDAALQRRGVRPGIPRLYKSAFAERIPPHIFFEAQNGSTRYSVSLNNTLEKPRPAWLFKTEELAHDETKIASRSPANARNDEQGLSALKIVEMEADHPAVQFFSLLRDYAIFSPTTLTLRGLTPDMQSSGLLGLSGGNLAEGVDSLCDLAKKDERIADALDDVAELIDWIKEFDVAPPSIDLLSGSVPRTKKVIRFHDRYMREGKNSLTAYDASEGALYVLFAAVLALHPDAPRCFAVDNLDQALNPRLVKNLTGKLCEWILEDPHSRQMLCTVHNPAVLDGLPLQNDDVRLFAVDRNSEGHTVVNRILVTEELQNLARDRGWPLSRLWVMGHLGAVPNV